MSSNKFKVILTILILVMLCICIWGVPLNGTRISVKVYGTNVSGTFTGMWSPVKGKEGTFMAEEGWIFEGIINPDGGLWKGELTNFPIPEEWRAYSTSDLLQTPEFYTGAVDDSVLLDVNPK